MLTPAAVSNRKQSATSWTLPERRPGGPTLGEVAPQPDPVVVHGQGRVGPDEVRPLAEHPPRERRGEPAGRDRETQGQEDEAHEIAIHDRHDRERHHQHPEDAHDPRATRQADRGAEDLAHRHPVGHRHRVPDGRRGAGRAGRRGLRGRRSPRRVLTASQPLEPEQPDDRLRVADLATVDRRDRVLPRAPFQDQPLVLVRAQAPVLRRPAPGPWRGTGASARR